VALRYAAEKICPVLFSYTYALDLLDRTAKRRKIWYSTYLPDSCGKEAQTNQVELSRNVE
jgi:hypothetical protein